MAASVQTRNLGKSKPLITAEHLREVLHYDPETGIWRWLVQRGRAKAGDVAGYRTRRGYRAIAVEWHSYLSHRLAVLYMTGKWPADEVDHKDGIPGNDWWDNLREATRSQNSMNTRKPTTNKSGYKGVIWDKPVGRWRATVRGRQIGHFNTPQEAHAAYAEAARERFGEFARLA